MSRKDGTTTLDDINRLVYMWARYGGTRVPEGKKYSNYDFSVLIERIKAYKENPEAFDWDLGEVVQEED